MQDNLLVMPEMAPEQSNKVYDSSSGERGQTSSGNPFLESVKNPGRISDPRGSNRICICMPMDPKNLISLLEYPSAVSGSTKLYEYSATMLVVAQFLCLSGGAGQCKSTSKPLGVSSPTAATSNLKSYRIIKVFTFRPFT